MNKLIRPWLALAFCSFSISAAPLSQYSNPATESSKGLFSNPAFLGWNDNMGWLINTNYPESDVEFFQLGLHTQNLGFAWETLPARNKDLSLNHYNLILGGLNIGDFAMAFNQGYTKTQDYSVEYWDFDYGFIYRPATWLSLGYESHNLLAGIQAPGLRHNLGLALRPFGENLTFYTGSQVLRTGKSDWDTFKDWDTFNSHYGLSLNITNGIEVGAENFASKEGFADDFRFYITLQMTPGFAFGFDGQTSGNQSGLSFSGDYSYNRHHGQTPTWVSYDMNYQVSETELPFSLFGESEAIALPLALHQFDLMQQDPSIYGVLLDLSWIRCGWAQATEIRRAIQELRSQGKQVLVYLEKITPINYYIASGSSYVAVHPSAWFEITGFSAEVLFFKGLFDKLDIQADFVRHGKYKSAVEPYTRDSMSVEFKADMQALLNDLWFNLRDSVVQTRGISPQIFDSLTANPSPSLQTAYDFGLIDTVLYPDQISEWLKLSFVKKWTTESAPLKNSEWTRSTEIAVIYLEGTIISGPSGSERFSGSSFAGSQTLSEQLEYVLNDPLYRAAVLRINSPGGSALASDQIWRQIQRFKEAGKPLVVSIGNTAASGGYYAACAADYIYTEAGSIVGSIGIFGGKLNLSGLYAKAGLNKDKVSTHPSADIHSDFRNYTETERTLIQGHMDLFYDGFVSKVAEGRGLSIDSVEQLAQGRVFTGAQAVQNGLADATGGLDKALRKAATLAGISTKRPIHGAYIWNKDDIFAMNMRSGLSLNQLGNALSREKIWAWSPSPLLY
jgi:protease-4